MKRVARTLLLPVLLLAGCAPAHLSSVPTVAPGPQPFTLTIVHSNDTWGYLLPCG